MGQGFSLTTLSAGSAGIDIPELADLVYEKSMGTARFMKSIRARHQDGVVLVKAVVKPYTMKLEKYKRKIIAERAALASVPNALAYQRIIETETSGFLVRQYLYSSLYDRMSTRPFLEDIEKKWLAFQLLCGVRDCHARDIFHGDIKTENTLVTSWNWLYLSDFSSSFKPTTLPEDNPADFSYFFDTAGRRTCYLAPERFLAAGEAPDPKAQITWAMDVFSAGCVIAELFLEAPIFTLSQLYKYRKGEYDPVSSHLNRIADKEVREMVAHMVQLNPESRYSAEQYLEFFRTKVFPDYFYSFLHQYMELITDPTSGRAPVSGASANLGEADERIDRIYYDFDKISYFLGYEDEKKPYKVAPKITGSRLNLLPIHLDIPNNEHPASTDGRRPTDDGTLIFLTLVVSSLRNTARATAKVRACDILLAFAERLTDEAKLDRVLPYLITLLTDKSIIVKVAAIRSVTQLLELVRVVSPVNAHVFPEYILPRMQGFLEGSTSDPQSLIRATYAACLGSLAKTASRFLDMVATLRADGSLPTADPETEGSEVDPALEGLFDTARMELIDIFAGHTKALITDSDSAVRRAFLGSVPELCLFFGTEDSNDIILSHLNTYLNDRDWLLKCAFFDTIVGVATFLGGTSLEEFILPLMVQALTDQEEFVIQRVIHSFACMADLGLFTRSKTWELVGVVGRFTMHPNIWIREASAMFLSSSTRFLSRSDIQCIILPLIKPYLRISVEDFSELALLDTLEKPLSRTLLDVSITWAVKVDRGIFWKPVQKLRTFSSSLGNQFLTTSQRDAGRGSLQKVSRNEEDEQWITKLRNQGLSPDDDFKLLSLREYIWRLARARGQEIKDQEKPVNTIINLRNIGIQPQTVMFDEQHLEEPLRQLHTVSQASDREPHTIADALLDASMSIDTSLAAKRRSHPGHKSRLSSIRSNVPSISPSRAMSSSPRDSEAPITDVESREQSSRPGTRDGIKTKDTDAGSLLSATSNHAFKPNEHRVRHSSSAMHLMNRKDATKTAAEIGMTQTNAVGRVEGPFSNTSGETSGLPQEIENEPRDRVRFRGAHTYNGNDPSILKMLDAMYVDNYPIENVEFGPMIAPSSRRKAITKSNNQATDQAWRPEGILVSTFSEHKGAINRVAVAPDHMFFLTGGDDGCVKVWDTGRLENNVARRARHTHKHAKDARVLSLCFVEQTHTFVSCASDGSVNVVKVETNQGVGLGSVRYNRLKVLREYQLPTDEYTIWSDHFKIESQSVLLLATNRSRVVAIDLRTMKTLYNLENPVHHGMPTCFCVDRKRNWLILGTSHGILDLWDLRFKVRLKAWGIPGSTPIYRITIHPTKGRGRWICVAGGSGQGEVTIWDVEKTVCREVYRAGGGSPSRETPRSYDPWPVDEDRPEGMLARFATTIDQTGAGSSLSYVPDRGVRAMVVGFDPAVQDEGRDSSAQKHGFIVTGGSDKKVRFWDLSRIENSRVVHGLATDETKPVFTSSHPTSPSVTVSVERSSKYQQAASSTPESSRTSSASRNNRATDDSVDSKNTSNKTSTKPPRSTVISPQQQQLLKSHLNAILDVALLESPYGMLVSVDRSGVIFIFQ